ncbi:hypothetical protein KYG33_07875 [Chryseobacterium sp. D764]|uniref:hypothetical protein n=1 Tax=Chryseobacterium sp. D764 TaxID=2856522 RepID=UPI001C57F7F2|nr:hypothetical protein [Chryseobacterium sp. D764]QXU50952.1 hypothetical protein KYG33_07875 [Chryseobacterium sp. D764]
MSIKIKQSLIKSLNKIKEQSFDEETIRTLLITAREFLKYEGLIKELAHFVAHTKRSQGIFHRKVNNRYTKMKLIEERIKNNEFQQIQSKIKTEDELSDFMLDGVGIDKVETKLFDILYRDGLEDIHEDHLIKYTGFNKRQAKKYLDDNYSKTNGYYYLKALQTERAIINLMLLPNKKNIDKREFENSIKQGLELTEKIKNTVDRLQRVIRGVIFYDSVFEAKSLNNEFNTVFENVLKLFDIDLSYIEDISDNSNDILLCIMALLHDSTFEFYDKNSAKVYLCAYLEGNIKKPIAETANNIFERGVLALYINYNFENSSNSYPLYVSDLKLQTYVSLEDFTKSPINNSIDEIPWISAERVNGKLILKS